MKLELQKIEKLKCSLPYRRFGNCDCGAVHLNDNSRVLRPPRNDSYQENWDKNEIRWTVVLYESIQYQVLYPEIQKLPD